MTAPSAAAPAALEPWPSAISPTDLARLPALPHYYPSAPDPEKLHAWLDSIAAQRRAMPDAPNTTIVAPRRDRRKAERKAQRARDKWESALRVELFKDDPHISAPDPHFCIALD